MDNVNDLNELNRALGQIEGKMTRLDESYRALVDWAKHQDGRIADLEQSRAKFIGYAGAVAAVVSIAGNMFLKFISKD